MLRHLAYFEALANMQEKDPEWRATTAGLVVLRLLDAWFEEGAELVASGSFTLRSAREEVEAIVPTDPVRTILRGVLDGMSDAGAPSMTTIAPRLMAYGRALHQRGRWKLVVDVYGTILEHADAAQDMDVLIDANMGMAVGQRMLGEFGPALESYAEAGRLARDAGDMVKELRARIGDAKIAIDRGNLPQAEAILDQAIQQTSSEPRLASVHATALHDRAAVAHLRGDYDRAIHLGYQALERMDDPDRRDRVLADIAASFFELGMRRAARDAHLILAATAQAQYSRWVATLNLLEIAAFDECEPVFEQYRRELASAALPPMLEVVYHLYVGKGHRTFGHVDAARSSLRQAVELANRHQYNQLLFDAEKALSDLQHGAEVERRAEVAASKDVEPVAAAIETMRHLAGISG